MERWAARVVAGVLVSLGASPIVVSLDLYGLEDTRERIVYDPHLILTLIGTVVLAGAFIMWGARVRKGD